MKLVTSAQMRDLEAAAEAAGVSSAQLMENAGLVWLYRLAREPRRLFRRYLVNDVIGLGLGLIDVAAIRLGRRRAVHG